MSGRYRCDPGVLIVSALRVGDGDNDSDDLELDESQEFHGYKLFDARAGHTDDAWIAFSRDADTADRLVRLLNEDDQKKGATK